MIRLLEEMSLGAWPALRTVVHDGWVLRFAGGYTRRANSVNPLYAGVLTVHEKIAFCEQRYRSHGQRVVFKITTAAQPRDLDSILRDRGYAEEGPSDVMVMPLTKRSSSRRSIRAREVSSADPYWLHAYADLNQVAPANQAILVQILAQVACPMCCVTIEDQGVPVSCGMAVVQGSWMGLFDIVTRSDRRRQGLATEVIDHLLAWGATSGAKYAYLQVMMQNEPAVSLYSKVGFDPAYRYWYRTKT